jgi:ankyrin repeat protein
MSSANDKLRDAAGRDNVAEIERQIAAGADPNAFEGRFLLTPLQLAAINGHIAAIAVLLKAGAHIDGADSGGETPLMGASADGRAAAIDALVAAGADVHRVRIDGHTALHVAAANGKLDAARVLLEAGARADICNKEGDRPINVVRCAAGSLVAAARSRHAAAPPRGHAQVCTAWGRMDKFDEAALRTLLTSAASWSRRRPVAIACYADVWEWE